MTSKLGVMLILSLGVSACVPELDLPDCPPGLLADKQEGVCEGVTKDCVDGESVEPDYTEIEGYEVGEKSLCDGLDNDCDGKVDEDVGVCQGQREEICSSPEGNYSGIEGHEPDEQSCDGVDNDCDGADGEDRITAPPLWWFFGVAIAARRAFGPVSAAWQALGR